jgi:hypothetical protein
MKNNTWGSSDDNDDADFEKDRAKLAEVEAFIRSKFGDDTFFFFCAENDRGTHASATGPAHWIQFYALKIYRDSCIEVEKRGYQSQKQYMAGWQEYGDREHKGGHE